MVDIQTVSIVIASASVVAGIVYYALQLRHQTKIRQTDLVMRLYSIYGSSEHWEAERRILATEIKGYDEFREKYPAGSPENAMLGTACVFFEGVGVLLHRKLIDIGLVDDLFSTSITQLWEKIELLTKEARRRSKRPQIWEWFEYLYNEMMKREQRLASKTA